MPNYYLNPPKKNPHENKNRSLPPQLPQVTSTLLFMNQLCNLSLAECIFILTPYKQAGFLAISVYGVAEPFDSWVHMVHAKRKRCLRLKVWLKMHYLYNVSV